MAITLDGFLNVVIPIGAFVFLGVVLFGKFQEPLSNFMTWLKNLFGWGAGKISSGVQNAGAYGSEVIVYR